MNVTATTERPSVTSESPATARSIKQKLRALWNNWVPMGYQDETGFHRGIQKRPNNISKK